MKKLWIILLALVLGQAPAVAQPTPWHDTESVDPAASFNRGVGYFNMVEIRPDKGI
jgi:hypothetical protein